MAARCYVIAEVHPYKAEGRRWLGQWGVWVDAKKLAHEFTSLSLAQASQHSLKDHHVRVVLKDAAPDD